MKLSRALWLCMGLSAASCGDDSHKPYQWPDAGAARDGGADATVGGNNPDGGGGDDGGTITKQRASRMVSVAPSYLVVGDTFNYTPKTTGKNSALDMEGAPSGMTLEKGTVSWKPTDDQAGAHTFKLRATGAGMAAGSVAEQSVTISVSKSTLRATATADETGGQVYAQSPDAMKVRGMGAAVPAHALTKEAKLSMGQLDTPPPTPNAEGSAVAVTFGPHGTVFGLPAYLTLGLPAGVTYAAERLGVYVYDQSGRWQRTPVLGVDIDNGLITSKALHFSVYAAIQSALDFDVTLANANELSGCAGSLLGSAELSSPWTDIELLSVNNLSDPLLALVASGQPSLQDALTMPNFSGSLRAVQVFDLVEGHGDQEVLHDRKLAVTTLYLAGDGTAVVTHGDALGNVVAQKNYPQLLASLDELASQLTGAATDVVFAGSADQQLGLSARVHYSYFPGDASYDPVSVDDLGIAAVERGPNYAPLGEAMVSDVDCDGVRDAFDVSDDRLLAAIDASPSDVVGAFTGDTVTLSARILRGGANASGSWSLLDGDGAMLTEVAMAPDARTFSAATSGRYLVSFKQTGGALEHIFAIDVADRAMGGAAPTCGISAQTGVGKVGDGVALTVVLSDDDSPVDTLTVEWGLLDGESAMPTLTPASTIFARGDDKALFAPLAAGNYTIGCRAFDGTNYSAVGQVDLSVVGPDANRVPTDVFLSPMAASTAPGTVVTFHAFARDPDGDALLFNWQLDGARYFGDPKTQGNTSVVQVQTLTSSPVTVTVSVTDGRSSPVNMTAKLLVADTTTPTSGVDMDGDGFDAGTGPNDDCNDNDPTIHPGAVDHCGDNIDSDCDGVLNPPDCDGDGVTAAQGDCDDANAKVYPGAPELCDGIDNNCDGNPDEGYSVGKQCTQGVGACAASGVLRCASDGESSLCTATPSTPMSETCNGIDDDCNGLIDDGNVCRVDAGVPDAGTTMDAGTAPFDASMSVTAEASVVGCVISGPEICTDGIDNDCDGYIDAADLDCQGQVVDADSCSSVVYVEDLSMSWKGTFDGAHYDFTSRCNPSAKYPDLVYAFDIDQDSNVSLIYNGMTPFSWSIQTGACNVTGADLTESFCDSDGSGKSSHVLSKGTYYLVLEGTKGEFDVQLNVKALILK